MFYLIFVENIFIMKNLTDFRKTLEAGVDPRLGCLIKKLEYPNITLCFNSRVLVKAWQ